MQRYRVCLRFDWYVFNQHWSIYTFKIWIVNETCLAANFAQLSLPCFQIGNCSLSKYKNDANEDLGLIIGDKTVKLGFNENDGCFAKTSGDTILYTSNLTYSCPQESGGIVTDVSNI